MSEANEPRAPGEASAPPRDPASEATLSVRVRLFAVLRERRGRDEEDVRVAVGTTVAGLYAALFPVGREGAIPVLFAVNREYASAAQVLTEGDEVAFIPPLGGG